jgi:hypothetical protein
MDIEIEMITIINAKTHIFCPYKFIILWLIFESIFKIAILTARLPNFLADTFYAMNDGSFVVWKSPESNLLISKISLALIIDPW